MAATRKKAPATAKRTKKAPPPPKLSASRIIGGSVALLLFLCVAVSYVSGEALALAFISKTLRGLIGWGYYLSAAAFLWCGILLLRKKQGQVGRRVTCTLLLPLLLGMLLHLFLCRTPYGFALNELKPLWQGGQAMSAGGMFAGSLAEGALTLLGKAVSAILFVLGFLTLLLGAQPFTMRQLLEKWWAYRDALSEDEPDDTQEGEPEEIHFAPKSARRDKPDRRVFPIDVPLDDEPLRREALPDSSETKSFFKPKKQGQRTPADVLNPLAPPQPMPQAESQAAPPAEAAPQVVPTEKTKAQKPSAAAEVACATAEVSMAIEKELQQPDTAYSYPPITLLDVNTDGNPTEVDTELRNNARRLDNTLSSFGVVAKLGEVIRGPSVTRYEFMLDSGVKLSKLTNLSDDIALALGASGVRIAPVPNKISAVGIEVPNKVVTSVRIRDVLESRSFTEHKSSTAFSVGKDIGGNSIVGNIARLPHVLIAGTTGSGKSVCTNSLIISLLYKSTPDEVRFIMVDPKMVELAPYNGIPHLLIPVVTDPKKAAGALQWAVFEMMKRYKMFSERGVKDLAGYNSLCENPVTAEEGMKKLPTVVVVIDELADLMLVAAKEVEESICRVAQMGRAAGMHLVIATQRPSADVITGLMKANIPSRIAFAVASSLESRIILDTTGAEKLVGKGDMLYFPLGESKPTRVQGCFITPEEIERVVKFVKQSGEASYDQTVMDKIEEALKKEEKSSGAAKGEEVSGDFDELLDAAVEVILETGQASVSMLQRRLKLGYSRAARLVDQMEECGYVGPFEGSKPRQLLITREKWQELQMKRDVPTEPPRPDPYGNIRDTFESHDALE